MSRARGGRSGAGKNVGGGSRRSGAPAATGRSGAPAGRGQRSSAPAASAAAAGALARTLPRGPWAKLSTRQKWQYALTLVAVAVLLVVALVAVLDELGSEAGGAGAGAGSGAGGSANGPAATLELPRAGSADELLDALEVKGRAPKTGYDRAALFGGGWQDPDGNGCDARNDVLLRDLSGTGVDDRCRVLSGVLEDPYTGTRVDFVRGETTSQAVQIDHVVALSDAWQKGAQALGPEQRLAFANDPLNLIAVDGPTNASKGDADAASWLPPETGFRCEYVARQISVKYAYGLWVTEAERDAMHDVLASCPGQPAYASDLAALVFME